MTTKWKRGLFRLYVVVWVVWLVFVFILLATSVVPGKPVQWGLRTWGRLLLVASFFGVVPPLLLLLAFRWIASGFKPDAPTKEKE